MCYFTAEEQLLYSMDQSSYIQTKEQLIRDKEVRERRDYGMDIPLVDVCS